MKVLILDVSEWKYELVLDRLLAHGLVGRIEPQTSWFSKVAEESPQQRDHIALNVKDTSATAS